MSSCRNILRLLELLDPFGPNWFSDAYWARSQARHVVVFKLPRDNETDYIKRSSLARDRIQMIDGRLYINNTMVPRDRSPRRTPRGATARHGSADL